MLKIHVQHDSQRKIPAMEPPAKGKTAKPASSKYTEAEKAAAKQKRHRNAKIKTEMQALNALLKTLDTSELIIKTSDFHDSLQNTEEDEINREAFNRYTKRSKSVTYNRIWADIEFYRAVGNTLDTLIDVPRTPDGQLVVDEILVLVHRWISLAADG